jgi:hypothetical protein
MHSEIEQNTNTGLLISNFRSNNIYPLLPLLSQEFPNWSMDRIKNYVKLVVSKEKGVSDPSGILVAQNNALYYVGLLIYTYQTITSNLLAKNNKDEFVNGIVVENLNVSSPILQKNVFFILLESLIKIAKKNNCDFVELPKIDDSYELIEKKYKKQIIHPNNFRFFINLKEN